MEFPLIPKLFLFEVLKVNTLSLVFIFSNEKMLKILGNAKQYLHDAPSSGYFIRVKCITPYGDGFESTDVRIQLGLQ